MGKHSANATVPNKSVFTISDDELKTILQQPNTMKSPVYNVQHANGVTETDKFVRQIDIQQNIGKTQNGTPTSIITIITDRGGNLINVYPGVF